MTATRRHARHTRRTDRGFTRPFRKSGVDPSHGSRLAQRATISAQTVLPPPEIPRLPDASPVGRRSGGHGLAVDPADLFRSTEVATLIGELERADSVGVGKSNGEGTAAMFECFGRELTRDENDIIGLESPTCDCIADEAASCRDLVGVGTEGSLDSGHLTPIPGSVRGKRATMPERGSRRSSVVTRGAACLPARQPTQLPNVPWYTRSQ